MLLLLHYVGLCYFLLFRQLQDSRILLGILQQNGKRWQVEMREVDGLLTTRIKEAGNNAALVVGLLGRGSDTIQAKSCNNDYFLISVHDSFSSTISNIIFLHKVEECTEDNLHIKHEIICLSIEYIKLLTLVGRHRAALSTLLHLPKASETSRSHEAVDA